MFINYGGTDRYIGDRKFVIENELGQSTYLRIRFILKNGYLSYQETLAFSAAVNSWKEKCAEKKLELMSVSAYSKYYRPVFEVDVDIAKTTLEAVDILFDEVEHHGCAEKVEKAKIGYCGQYEWY